MSGYIKGLPPFCELRQIPFLLSGPQLCHLKARRGKLDSVFSLLSANVSILWTWVPGSKALVLIFTSTYPAFLWAGTVLIILDALFHLIFTVTFWGLFYYLHLQIETLRFWEATCLPRIMHPSLDFNHSTLLLPNAQIMSFKFMTVEASTGREGRGSGKGTQGRFNCWHGFISHYLWLVNHTCFINLYVFVCIFKFSANLRSISTWKNAPHH